MSKIAVLAFSGGLDTSYCAKYYSKEKGLNIHSVIINTGGFSEQELKEIEKRAHALGVSKHVCIDISLEYYKKCIRYMIYGNILKNNTYPLSVSSERIFQAMALAKYARDVDAGFIIHGSTGAGNDQVRFDLAFQVICPDIEILTPVRDEKLTREYEIQYLKDNGIEFDFKKAEYSINQGLWGTSIGGKETLKSALTIPESAYPSQLEATEPMTIELEFDKGEVIALQGVIYKDPLDVIQELNAIASKYAIGRGMHVGDTIIGIKGRVAFEAAGPMIIIKAHHQLEKHNLTKWQLYWKEQLANWYGMLLHEAQYQEPVMRNIEKFLEDTQTHICGKVFIKLYPYNFDVIGIDSKYDMMQAKFAQYGEMNTAFSGEDVKGFTKILSNQIKLYNSVED
ncbi:MAG: Argininosuccinate synthase [Bacteroidetes bacterium ADurb.Bin217]|nr:MAG: Argininosuccinate synthase [Bacteroidetes bacterium ADurb.Bin217]HOS84114.1 argininosuccinate synthase [Bacteroidales bacterium]